MITLTEMKDYLRVDGDEDDALITTLMNSAQQLCMDVARTDDVEEYYTFNYGAAAVMYATNYLYEHRTDADHHSLVMSLRSILSGAREAKSF